MTQVFQIANQMIALEEIVPLLASYQLFPQLLSELIIDQAIASIDCTPEETAHACQELYNFWNLKSEQQQTWRSHYGLSQDKLERLATRQLRVAKFKQATWGHTLESYFLKRKHQFDQIIYSLLRTRDRGIANELFFRIQGGEQSFADLAHHYSAGSEAKTYGLMGPIELGSLSSELAELLRTSPVGRVQPPVVIGEWQVIVRVEQLLPACLDESMRQRLLQENFEIWFQERLHQLSDVEKIWMGVEAG